MTPDRTASRLLALAIGLAATLLAAAPPASAAEGPVTAAADSLRTGWFPDEGQLTPQLLAGGGFGQVFDTPVQGQVYAQPLVSGGTVFVATEDNWIYGIDAGSGATLWSRRVAVPWNSSEIPGCNLLSPHVGITGAPVIDPGTNTAYFFAKTYASGESGPAAWDMHAVDLADGSERPGFPVRISGEAENLPGVTFDPTQHLQRPALLLMNGVVYAGFGSLCDTTPYQGWIVGVSTSGQIRAMWAAAPEEAAIWQAGGGLVSDGEGQILFATGNGPPPPQGLGESPPEGELGESVVRAEVQPGGSLKAIDFFSPFDNLLLSEQDLDLGSGAPLALPSQYFGTEAHPHLLVQGGKQGVIYLLDRDDLGGMGQGTEGKDAVLDQTAPSHPVFGSSAAWPGDGGYVYVPSSAALEMLRYGLDEGNPSLTPAATSETFRYGSGSPVVTSNGTTPGSAIVWISRCPGRPCTEATLNAYAAVPVEGSTRVLWRGALGSMPQFARPEPANGRIYVGTGDGHLRAFGPLPGPAVPNATVQVSPPQTRITSVRINRRKGRATFRFRGVGSVTRLQCELIRPRGKHRRGPRASFSSCASPKRYRHLRPGRYTFKVRALNSTGPDPTPAKRRFKI